MERIQKCPRFTTIRSAVAGDEIAMEKVLNHYNACISKAAKGRLIKLQADGRGYSTIYG